MFTNKKREGINRFVCDLSLYVAETPKASIKYRKPLLPIIPFGIVAYGFVGQPFVSRSYTIYKLLYENVSYVSSSVTSKQLCFVHGQGKKRTKTYIKKLCRV